jgi:PPOX class probable F420-dependent enzyme
MIDDRARRSFETARVAALATVRRDGTPHLVPITFAVDGTSLFSCVDGKPKRHNALQRLVNLRHSASVSVLADAYDEDWRALWWVRADGTATIHDTGDAVERAHRLLREKYPQYGREVEPGVPVIEVELTRWTHWRAG